MDYETKILLNRLIEAVEKLDSPDWWTIALSILGIALSSLLSFLVYKLTRKIGKQQTDLQKANIKLILYDKRYKVYETLLQSQYINDIDYWLTLKLQKETKNAHSMIDPLYKSHTDLYNASMVASTIFPKEIAYKVNEAYERFNKVIIEHMRHVNTLSAIIRDNVEEVVCVAQEAKAISSSHTATLEEYQQNLKKLMTIFGTETIQYPQRTAYIEWLKEANVLEEIKPYINIETLDQ